MCSCQTYCDYEYILCCEKEENIQDQVLVLSKNVLVDPLNKDWSSSVLREYTVDMSFMVEHIIFWILKAQNRHDILFQNEKMCCSH
jgi:hypothetical protein